MPPTITILSGNKKIFHLMNKLAKDCVRNEVISQKIGVFIIISFYHPRLRNVLMK